MERFEWRSSARIAAWFDLFVTGIIAIGTGLCALYILICVFRGSTVVAATEKLLVVPLPLSWHLVGAIWVIVVVIGLFILVQLWAAVKLLNGTEMEQETSEALVLCKTWRNVCILFLICNFLEILLTGMVVVVVFLLIRGTLLFVVVRFIIELETAKNPTQNPAGFVV